MSKIDFKKDLAELYRVPAGRAVEVMVPPLRYLTIDGRGGPASPDYGGAIATLYPVVYTLKYSLRPEVDFVVGPLETMWWAEPPATLKRSDPAEWRWKAMIVVPDLVEEAHLADAADELHRTNKPAPLLDSVTVETIHEGLAVQVMHIGPYDTEAATISLLHAYITDNGFSPRGHHHEIYLSSPRTTAPENLKTVIRQPVH